MQLNYKVFGEGFPLIILHGLMGSLDNWQTLAKAFSVKRKVYIIDQRDHGRSPHVPQISFPLMAADLLEFMEQQHLAQTDLIGHSMGGKTVMEFTLHHPEKVNRQVVVDIAPKAYQRQHDPIFDALFSVDLKTLHHRSEAEAALAKKIQDNSMRQFLLKNLDRMEDGSYQWKFNLRALNDQYPNIMAGITPGTAVNIPTLVLRSGTSGYIKEDDRALFEQYFTNVKMVTFENTGHWIHAEKPKEFLEVVNEFLDGD